MVEFKYNPNLEQSGVQRDKLKVLISPGKLIVKDRRFRDQLTTNDVWYDTTRMNNYLVKNYNITKEDYWNLVHTGDINYRPKCEICGKPVYLFRLSGYRKYCSQSCWSTAMNHIKWSRPDYREARLKSFYENCRNDNISYKRISIQECNLFKNKIGLDTKCVFYLGITDDNKLKFGVTSDTSSDLSYRVKFARWRGINFKTIHKVIEGRCEFVADIECGIKLMRKNSSEFVNLSGLHEIIELIRILIKENINKQ